MTRKNADGQMAFQRYNYIVDGYNHLPVEVVAF